MSDSTKIILRAVARGLKFMASLLDSEMDADARGVPFTKSPWAERIIIGEVHFLKKEK